MSITKEKFTKICKEYDYPDETIERLWASRSLDVDLPEEKIRKVTKDMAPSIKRTAYLIKQIEEIEGS